jgi:secreted PhoX family phosphatase
VTPWGSWLTCEETEATKGTLSGGQTLAEDHGWVFEVLPAKASAQVPRPIKAWGRFPHEAVVVAPDRRHVYLTEDASSPNGLLYRWTAPAGYKLGAGMATQLDGNQGRLEAMIVRAPDGSVLPDLAYVTSAQIGRPFHTSWVSVPDRQATSTSVRKQFNDGEITRSKKLEGAWGDRYGFYFASSFAYADADLPANATKHDGQIWYYNYAKKTLTLKAYFPYNPLLHAETPNWESTIGASLDLAFDGPDNVHVSPYGGLIIAEDGNTANHLISWSDDVGAQAVARNLIVLEPSDEGGNVYSEMTGPTFTPDGSLLFANVQQPGHTFVIRGPWRHYLG